MTLAQMTVEGVAGGTAIPVNTDGEAVTELQDAATGAAAGIAATLAAAANERTYIVGFHVDGLGATAASVIEVTITGLTVTMRYKLSIPAGAAVALAARLCVEFTRPIPASADNTAIVVNVPSFGAGNTSAVVAAHGFRK